MMLRVLTTFPYPHSTRNCNPWPTEVENVEITANCHEIDMDVDDDLDGYDNEKDDEATDPQWQPTDDEKVTLDDDVMLTEEELESYSPDSEKKFLVFHSCLDELLKRCPQCGDVVIQQNRKTVGSMLSIDLTCHSGHKQTWESQPVLKKKPLGNLLMEGAILFTRNSYTSISRLASCLNLQFFSESVFYDKPSQISRSVPSC